MHDSSTRERLQAYENLNACNIGLSSDVNPIVGLQFYFCILGEGGQTMDGRRGPSETRSAPRGRGEKVWGGCALQAPSQFRGTPGKFLKFYMYISVLFTVVCAGQQGIKFWRGENILSYQYFFLFLEAIAPFAPRSTPLGLI